MMKIGERVTWEIGKIKREGLWMSQYNNEMDEVMCIKAGDQPMALKCNVPRKLLTK